MPDPTFAPADLERAALDAAAAAAGLIRSRLDRNAVIALKSSPTDVVTQTDLDSEALIRRQLSDVTPGAGFIGEEGGSTYTSSDLQWIIDPLDGTVNFAFGIPVFAVSIGAAIAGELVAGVVIDVVTGETFSAALGCGARCNGRSITVSSCDAIERAMVLTGFSYTAELRRAQALLLNELLPSVRDIRCIGSAALELCWVAAGRVDGYYERDTKLWDYAAGALIAAEAGAEIELPCPENEGLVVAAGPGVFAPLRALVDHHNAAAA